MAFTLKDNNTSGNPSIDASTGSDFVEATDKNFISAYEYNMGKYAPKLDAEIYKKYGSGRITSYVDLMGGKFETDFASDVITWSEQKRLHNILKDVAVSGNQFTSTTPHLLSLNDVVLISDGTVEKQAQVSAITSNTVFEALNADAGAYGFAGNVTIMLLSNNQLKGAEYKSGGISQGFDLKSNYPQIIFDSYEVSNSDMAHDGWITVNGNKAWYSYELDRTLIKYDNKLEFTHLFGRRADPNSDVAQNGLAQGMEGIIPQIEKGGNIANERLSTIEDLSDIAYRAKQQGGRSRSFTSFGDHVQQKNIRQMLASVNSHYAEGANYGMFNNSKDTALHLGFTGAHIDGVDFYFANFDYLDDPTLFGAEHFNDTSIAALIVPSGETYTYNASKEGQATPYLSIMYRGTSGMHRDRTIEFFGEKGTKHKFDKTEMHIKTEQTNRLVGANEFFVVRRGTGIYS